MTANLTVAAATVAGAIIISHLFEHSSASAPSDAYASTLEESTDYSTLVNQHHITASIDWNVFEQVNADATKLAAKVDYTDHLATTIKSKYTHVSDKMAEDIVQYAKMYEHEVFPKAEDILAVIAIESSFIPSAKSNLKKDPAVGLMQVRPGVWRHLIDRSRMYDIEHQIETGAKILADYYQQTGTRRGAIQAYNLGITAYNRGARTEKYLSSYRKELAMFK